MDDEEITEWLWLKKGQAALDQSKPRMNDIGPFCYSNQIVRFQLTTVFLQSLTNNLAETSSERIFGWLLTMSNHESVREGTRPCTSPNWISHSRRLNVITVSSLGSLLQVQQQCVTSGAEVEAAGWSSIMLWLTGVHLDVLGPRVGFTSISCSFSIIANRCSLARHHHWWTHRVIIPHRLCTRK